LHRFGSSPRGNTWEQTAFRQLSSVLPA